MVESFRAFEVLIPDERDKTRLLGEGLACANERLNNGEDELHLHAAQEMVAQLREGLDVRDIPDRRNMALHLLIEDYPSLREICIRVSMMHRFNKAVREQQLEYTNRQQIVRCFKAMHASQSSSADFCSAGQARFAQTLAHQQTRALALEEQGPLEAQETSFSLARFRTLEAAIWDSEMSEKDKHLHAFFNHFFQDGNLTAYEKSLRLRSPYNAPLLAGIRELDLHDTSAIPDEIETLSSLRFVRIEGNANNRLCDLPKTFGNLPQLSNLVLFGHDFHKLPDALGKLPPLWKLRITSKISIREFPEELARKQYGGSRWLIYDLICSTIYDDHPNPPWYPEPRNKVVGHFGWLPQADLTDIPFFLWFRENFSISYFPVFIPNTWLYNLLEPFFFSPAVMVRKVVESLTRSLGLWAEIPLVIVSSIPFFIIPVALLLLNLPIFLYNLFINLAIEPIVTFVRENLLGYSPMVHIRD